jgi:hypothetical protein
MCGTVRKIKQKVVCPKYTRYPNALKEVSLYLNKHQMEYLWEVCAV